MDQNMKLGFWKKEIKKDTYILKTFYIFFLFLGKVVTNRKNKRYTLRVCKAAILLRWSEIEFFKRM